MNRKLAATITVAFVAAFPLAAADPAAAATTLIVNGAGPCSAVASPFCTIQQGVNAAGPGNIVLVEPGTYTEQVTIGPGKDGLKLKADGPGVTIKAPDVMVAPGSIVRVTTSRLVRIRGFTITGPVPGCADLVSGVRVDGGGKALVTDDHITAIRAEPLAGCQPGHGVIVGRVGDSPGDAVIINTVIDDYQKGGVLVDLADSHAFLRNVTITGTPTAIIAQNGVQVARGALAEIRNSTISNNRYTGPDTTTDASGVLVFGVPSAGRAYMRDDTTMANDINVWLFGAIGSKIVSTTSTGATTAGIAVNDTSSGNILKFLTATGNGPPDIEDDSVGGGTFGTANTWKYNTCGVSFPAAICA
jgi:hypothetical protein